MADRKQGAGLSSGSSAAVHIKPIQALKILPVGYHDIFSRVNLT